MTDESQLSEQRIRLRAYELWQEAGSPDGEEQRFWQAAKADITKQEAKLDKELADSFPSSDPPSSGVITGATGDHPVAMAEADKPAPSAKTKPAQRTAK